MKKISLFAFVFLLTACSAPVETGNLTEEPGTETVEVVKPMRPVDLATAAGEEIMLNDFPQDGLITSGMVIEGYAPEAWGQDGFFIELMADSGDVLANFEATQEGGIADGMVPFTAKLSFFAEPGTGALIFTSPSDEVGDLASINVEWEE